MTDLAPISLPPIDLDQPVPMEAIEAVVAYIAREFNPERVILFGSHAYGEPKPWSDVDLLVVMDTPLTPHQQRLEIARSLLWRPFGIDVIVRTPADLECRIDLGDFFLREIVGKGKVIYERRR